VTDSELPDPDVSPLAGLCIALGLCAACWLGLYYLWRILFG
jgi:hypothetical protein